MAAQKDSVAELLELISHLTESDEIIWSCRGAMVFTNQDTLTGKGAGFEVVISRDANMCGRDLPSLISLVTITFQWAEGETLRISSGLGSLSIAVYRDLIGKVFDAAWNQIYRLEKDRCPIENIRAAQQTAQLILTSIGANS